MAEARAGAAEPGGSSGRASAAARNPPRRKPSRGPRGASPATGALAKGQQVLSQLNPALIAGVQGIQGIAGIQGLLNTQKKHQAQVLERLQRVSDSREAAAILFDAAAKRSGPTPKAAARPSAFGAFGRGRGTLGGAAAANGGLDPLLARAAARASGSAAAAQTAARSRARGAGAESAAARATRMAALRSRAGGGVAAPRRRAPNKLTIGYEEEGGWRDRKLRSQRRAADASPSSSSAASVVRSPSHSPRSPSSSRGTTQAKKVACYNCYRTVLAETAREQFIRNEKKVVPRARHAPP